MTDDLLGWDDSQYVDKNWICRHDQLCNDNGLLVCRRITLARASIVEIEGAYG